MEPTWQFQLRITVSLELANDLRTDPEGASHAALRNVLRKHNAILKCQFDAFANYVSEAEKQGTENYPLYQWTRQTIENPEKKAKYLQSFTVYVNGDEIYGKEVADALEAELTALASDDGIKSVTRFDSNPANNPQPPKR
jgi:predicted metal-dependent hydrolase